MVFKSVEEFLKENSEDSRLGLGARSFVGVRTNQSEASRKKRQNGEDPGRASAKAVGGPTTIDGEIMERARRIVMKELAAGPKTRYQLAGRLKQGKFPQGVVEALLDRCQELNLVNDREYAVQWAQKRSEHKYLGKSILARELAKKGIKQHYIDEALEQVAVSDEELARVLVDKKLVDLTDISDFKECEKHKRRLFALLTRKGIPVHIAFEVINQKIISLRKNLDA